jgi:oligoendopeptidase F
MEQAVVEAYPRLSHRYYALKAKVMGRESLDYWDRNAPLTAAAPRAYGWTEAKGMVLESFQDLAPKFADTARTFFDRRGSTPGRGRASSRAPTPIRSPPSGTPMCS